VREPIVGANGDRVPWVFVDQAAGRGSQRLGRIQGNFLQFLRLGDAAGEQLLAWPLQFIGALAYCRARVIQHALCLDSEEAAISFFITPAVGEICRTRQNARRVQATRV